MLRHRCGIGRRKSGDHGPRAERLEGFLTLTVCGVIASLSKELEVWEGVGGYEIGREVSGSWEEKRVGKSEPFSVAGSKEELGS